MSDLEIVIEFHRALQVEHISRYTYNSYDCDEQHDCNACSFLYSCKYLAEEGNGTAETSFAKRIYPLLQLDKYSYETLYATYPELFI